MKAEHIAISERIAKHLETQMALSYDPAHGCRYRGPNGTSCAVGCLITDEAYNETGRITLEGSFAASEFVKIALRRSGIEVDCDIENLLMLWQQYHDGVSGGPTYTYWLSNADRGVSPTEFHKSLMS